MNKDYNIAIEAAIEGGKAILEIYNSTEDIQVTNKADNSPLTLADQAANKVINSFLEQTSHPIISEENKQLPFSERQSWETCWIVDPLDGTKEFIKKNGEFTVNIALCEAGRPIFGVIYVPVSRELYYGDVQNKKAFKTILEEDLTPSDLFFKDEDQIFPAQDTNELVRVVGSRSHMNTDTEAFIASIKDQYKKVEIVSKGSSLKFCLVAEGKADIYPRYAPTMEWDTAAGQAICEAAGLNVIDQVTQRPMVYNRENLLNSYFLVR